MTDTTQPPAETLADQLTPNQIAVLQGRDHDIDSRRARTRARNDLRAIGLMWSEGDGITPKGQSVLAALTRRAGGEKRDDVSC